MTYRERIKQLGQSENDIKLIKDICSEVRYLEPKKAKDIYLKLIDYTKTNNIIESYLLVMYKYSWTQYDLGNLEEAININLELVRKFEEYNNIEDMLNSINFLVGLYSNVQDFANAMRYAKYGLKVAEENGNYQKLYDIKCNIAVLYLEIEEYEDARELYSQIMKLPNICGIASHIANMVNLSECELECGNYENALKYATEILDVAEDEGQSTIPYIKCIIGRIYKKLGKYEIANRIFLESVEMSVQGNFNMFYNDAMVYWAALDLKLEKYEEAINKVESLDNENTTFSAFKNRIRMYKVLQEAYNRIGKSSKAYYYMNKLNKIECEFYSRKINSLKKINGTIEKQENEIFKILQEETEKLYSVCQKITSNLNRDNIFKVFEEGMTTLFEYDFVEIAMINGNELEYELCVENGERVNLTATSLDEEGLGVYCFKNKQDVLINDLSKDYEKYITSYRKLIELSYIGQESEVEEITQSMIFVPIIVGENAIGILSIQSYKKNIYDIKDVNKLKVLSTYLGIALENSRYYRELKYIANYDVLTKILNRRTVLEKVENIFEQVKLLGEWGFNKEEVPNCYNSELGSINSYIIMIDVDNFKKVNDTYGHLIGDKVLYKVAKSIKKSIGKDDFVGRYGGEEFIVVINQYKSRYMIIAEEIRRNIEEMSIQVDKSVNDKWLKVTASLGVAKITKEYNNINEIIYKADQCLYKAKSSGKNKVVFGNQKVDKSTVH